MVVDVIELSRMIQKDKILLRTKTEELEMLTNACMLTGISFDGEKTQGTSDPARVENAYLKLINAREEVAELAQIILSEEEHLMKIIHNSLDDDVLFDIAIRKLVKHQSITQISKEIHYSRSQTHNLYKKSLSIIFNKDKTKSDT